MRSKLIHVTLSLVVFVGLSLALVLLTSASRSQPTAALGEVQAHEHGEASDAHTAEVDTHGGHEDAEDHASQEPISLEALRQLECEHNCPTVDCDECRYELGVARLDPDVAEGLVQTHRVAAKPHVRDVLEVTGEIQLDLTRVVDVTSAGSGRVEAVSRLLGDTVDASETLAVVQSAEFGQVQADFLEAQAKFDLARQTFEREKSLSQQKISSQADFLTARKEFVAAQVAQTAVRKRLQLFGLNAEQIDALTGVDADERFGQLVLTAPIAGTILEQEVVRGQWVDSSQRLYRIADLSRLWVWCNVYESDLAKLYERMGSTDQVDAQIRVAAFPNETFAAVVDLIGSQLDRDTRTLKVRLVADNAQGKLKPGMYVTALIPMAECEQMVHVPQSAVLSDEGRHFVFARLSDDLWIRRDVTVGHRDKDMIEVVDGLQEGDIVATKGAFMFKSEVLKEKMGAGCAH